MSDPELPQTRLIRPRLGLSVSVCDKSTLLLGFHYRWRVYGRLEFPLNRAQFRDDERQMEALAIRVGFNSEGSVSSCIRNKTMPIPASPNIADGVSPPWVPQGMP